MYLLIIYCVGLTVVEVNSEYNSLELSPCNVQAPSYILQGRIVQTTRKNYFDLPSSGIVIKACNNSSQMTAKTVTADQLLQNELRAELWGLSWPSLQELSLLERVDMLDVAPVGEWGDCSKLSVLSIHTYSNRLLISPDWLNNCTQLTTLTLIRLSVSEIRAVINSAPNVKELNLYAVRDAKVSHIVNESLIPTSRGRHQWIKKVFVLGINRDYEDYTSKADDTKSIQKINESSWAEISAALMKQLSILPRLEEVAINDKNFDFCPEDFAPVTLKSLKSLKLWSAGTTRPCFNKLRIMPKLHEFSVWFSDVFKLQFSEMIRAPALQFTVQFVGVNLPSIEFVRDDYLRLSDVQLQQSQIGNVTLKDISLRIDCDCDGTLWLARALRQKLVTAPGVLCNDGTAPQDLPCEQVGCERVPCEGGCVCCSLEARTGVLADCREAGLSVLPPGLLQHTNLTRLLAPRNHIHTLPDSWPDTLTLVDLSNNSIWQYGLTAVDALFTQTLRRVRLTGNIIYCSCDTKSLIFSLKDHQHQIEDFESLTCAITGDKISVVNITHLCENEDRNAELFRQEEIILMTVPLTLVIFAASVIFCIILYYKRRELQIYLFSRGWCLCCMQEDELDADRRYDVFLSFCHEDTELVLEKLLPVLDREYAVCIHLRDWIPGDVIPSQITQSVDQSRRTVVVFSRAFVKSIWGRLEFETAHVSGLMEGRVRVVMIVVDDVLEWEELPNDLRAYVRLNTYVKLDDPWFWEKMRYALPHNSSIRKQDHQEQCDVETGETQSQQMNSIVSRELVNSIQTVESM